MRDRTSTETGVTEGIADGTALTAVALIEFGMGAADNPWTDNDTDPEGRTAFDVGPGITAEIAADAAPADELCAATAPTFTWARDDNGLRAIQTAAREDQCFFTSLE